MAAHVGHILAHGREGQDQPGVIRRLAAVEAALPGRFFCSHKRPRCRSSLREPLCRFWPGPAPSTRRRWSQRWGYAPCPRQSGNLPMSCRRQPRLHGALQIGQGALGIHQLLVIAHQLLLEIRQSIVSQARASPMAFSLSKVTVPMASIRAFTRGRLLPGPRPSSSALPEPSPPQSGRRSSGPAASGPPSACHKPPGPHQWPPRCPG